MLTAPQFSPAALQSVRETDRRCRRNGRARSRDGAAARSQQAAAGRHGAWRRGRPGNVISARTMCRKARKDHGACRPADSPGISSASCKATRRATSRSTSTGSTRSTACASRQRLSAQRPPTHRHLQVLLQVQPRGRTRQRRRRACGTAGSGGGRRDLAAAPSCADSCASRRRRRTWKRSARRFDACANCVERAERDGHAAGHAVDGHERRPRGCGAGRCDDRPRRHGDIRRLGPRLAGRPDELSHDPANRIRRRRQHGHEPDRRPARARHRRRPDHRRRPGRGAARRPAAPIRRARSTKTVRRRGECADVVVLAVKPQQMADVGALDRAHVVAERRPLVISIAAGIRLADLARWLGARAGTRAHHAEPSGVDRRRRHGACMPTPMSTPRRAETAETDHGRVRRDGLGRTRSADGRRDGGLRQRACLFPAADRGPRGCRASNSGMDRRDRAHCWQSRRRGAPGRMAAESPDAPALQRAQVTSKGGTTAAAMRGARVGGRCVLFLRGRSPPRRAARPSSRANSAPPRP